MQFTATLDLTKVSQLHSQKLEENLNESAKMIKRSNNRMAFLKKRFVSRATKLAVNMPNIQSKLDETPKIC